MSRAPYAILALFPAFLSLKAAYADVYAGAPPLVCRTKADFVSLNKKDADQQKLISSGKCWRLDKDWQASILEWNDFSSKNISRWKIKNSTGKPITVWGPVLGDG
ncbi:MAG: hypothetical protein PW843_05155 [Azospirillaceae bacterium]|nr:hypothetical protein [Azospirillaceae bacterium]